MIRSFVPLGSSSFRPAALLAPLLLASLGCGPKAPAEPTVDQAAPEEPPHLLVYVVVDQLPLRLMEEVEPLFQGGLARLTGDEAFVATAAFDHAITFTCPGHATLSTGAPPAVNGIPSNQWYEDGEHVYCADIDFLRAEPLADVVHEAGGRVASLSQKDRSAVMMGGNHAELVTWYDGKADGYVNSEWAAQAILTDDYRNEPWEPLFPDFYAQRYADDQPTESGPFDLGNTFPRPPLNELDPRVFNFTPFSGTALTDLALQAIEELELGQGRRQDLLAISYAHNDYIGHAFTSESWETMDALARLDLELDRLFEHLDTHLGDGRYTVILSSDHGAAKHTDLRIDKPQVTEAADAALKDAGLPAGSLFEDPGLWLPPELHDDPEAYEKGARQVAEAVQEIPGIAAAYPWRLEGGLPDDAPHADAIRASLDEERSGDLYLLLEHSALYNFPGSEGRGTSHGTPYDYDRLVPLLAYGAGVTPGSAEDPLRVAQIPATAATLLGLRPPADSQGEPVAALLEPAEPTTADAEEEAAAE